MWQRVRRGMIAMVWFGLAACGGGGGGSGGDDIQPANQMPSASVIASGDLTMTALGLEAAIGGTVTLDGARSADPDRDPLTYEWRIVARPTGSRATLDGTPRAEPRVDWRPDVAGQYVLALKVTDPRGASASQQITVQVGDRTPTGSLYIPARFSALATTPPAQSVTVGGGVVVDATDSRDPDGDTLSIAFDLLERPVASTATVTVNERIARFTADVPGTYRLRTRGTDARGAGFEVTYTAVADNRPPTPVVAIAVDAVIGNGGSQTVPMVAGQGVTLNASGSSDADGDSFTRAWSLTSRPAGSTAALSTPTGVATQLTTDVRGSYVVTLTLTDARGARTLHTTTLDATNRAPTPIAEVAFDAVVAQGGSQTVQTTEGYGVLLNGQGSFDADGDAVSRDWAFVSTPAGSLSSLSTFFGTTTSFTPDMRGDYVVALTVTDSRGARSRHTTTVQVTNRVPNPVVAFTANPVVGNGGNQTVQTSLGYDLLLSGAGSTDADGDALSYAWALASRPAGSAAALTSATGITTGLVPDMLGTYGVTLTVTDTRGARSVFTTTVQVNNRRPVAQIGTNATPQALPFAPAVRLPLGTELTLRGGASSDADGDTLVHAWTIATRPAGSTAALSSASAVNPKFTADREGLYVVRLRVTDPAGAYSERTLNLTIGGHPPVAVLDKDRVTVLVGEQVRTTGALSFDEDGDALTYEWALDSRPAGSAVTVTSSNSPTLSFTPDVVGTYVIAMTVRSGGAASVDYLTVRALAQAATSVSLNFAPDVVRYSQGLDKVVTLSTNPDAVRIIDPFTGLTRGVALPSAATRLNLSGDGKLAVVGHGGTVSLIDLEAAVLVRTMSTGGASSDPFVTDTGMIHLVGLDGSYGYVRVIDGRTGVAKAPQAPAGAYLRCPSQGVMAHRINKVFMMGLCYSPGDIEWYTYDATGATTLAGGDSPYHGDYAMAPPLFLSANHNLVFTYYGNYFRTDTLAYAGALTGLASGGVVSLSHSSVADELILVAQGDSATNGQPASYRRFTGALMIPDTALGAPTVGGVPSYVVEVFHAANGRHVLLVQTGTDQPRGAGVAYHLVSR